SARVSLAATSSMAASISRMRSSDNALRRSGRLSVNRPKVGPMWSSMCSYAVMWCLSYEVGVGHDLYQRGPRVRERGGERVVELGRVGHAYAERTAHAR